MGIIVTLFIASFALLLAEVFLPGGVLGVLGGLALIAGVIVSFVQYGLGVGLMTMCGAVLALLVGFAIWLRFFPRSKIGRKFSLTDAVRSENDNPQYEKLVGLEGVALTPMRPSGVARIGGRRVDVVADGSFIPEGETLVVLRVEGSRVVVRKKLAP